MMSVWTKVVVGVSQFGANLTVSFSLCRNAEDPLQCRPLEDQTSLHGCGLHHGLQLAAQPKPPQRQPEPTAAHWCRQRQREQPQEHSRRPACNHSLWNTDAQRQKLPQKRSQRSHTDVQRDRQHTLAAGWRCKHKSTNTCPEKRTQRTYKAPTWLPGQIPAELPLRPAPPGPASSSSPPPSMHCSLTGLFSLTPPPGCSRAGENQPLSTPTQPPQQPRHTCPHRHSKQSTCVTWLWCHGLHQPTDQSAAAAGLKWPRPKEEAQKVEHAGENRTRESEGRGGLKICVDAQKIRFLKRPFKLINSNLKCLFRLHVFTCAWTDGHVSIRQAL